MSFHRKGSQLARIWQATPLTTAHRVQYQEEGHTSVLGLTTIAAGKAIGRNAYLPALELLGSSWGGSRGERTRRRIRNRVHVDTSRSLVVIEHVLSDVVAPKLSDRRGLPLQRLQLRAAVLGRLGQLIALLIEALAR